MPLNECKTEDVKLIGADGYSADLYKTLEKEHNLEHDVAYHLSRSYGDQSEKVVELGTLKISNKHPYISGEVYYAMRNEYANTIVDVLARRTRLAFIDCKEAGKSIKIVSDIMAKELNWSESEKIKQENDAVEFLKQMGSEYIVQ